MTTAASVIMGGEYKWPPQQLLHNNCNGTRFYFELTGSSAWRLFVEWHLIYGLIMKTHMSSVLKASLRLVLKLPVYTTL